jgi:hypothetical protein
MPVAGVQFVAVFIWFFARICFKTHKQSVTKNTLLFDHLSGFHLLILGFVYTLGYMVPSLTLIIENSKSPEDGWYPNYILKSLAVDLIFTLLMSTILLKRKAIQKLEVIWPIILSILTIVIIDYV